MADAIIRMTNPSRAPAPEPSRPLKIVSPSSQHELKSAVHHELIKRNDLERLGVLQGNRGDQNQLLTVIHQLLAEQRTPLSAAEREIIGQEVLDELFGLGPLEPLLQDPSVNDILVN